MSWFLSESTVAEESGVARAVTETGAPRARHRPRPFDQRPWLAAIGARSGSVDHLKFLRRLPGAAGDSAARTAGEQAATV